MISYRFEEHRVTIQPCFLYEITIYKLSKNMVELLSSKFYKSEKLLNIKNEETILEKTKDYSIVKGVDIIGVTEEFKERNNLQIYEPKKPIKKTITVKKTSKKRKRK